MSMAVVLCVTAGSYATFNSDLFFIITDEIGLFPYYALTPFVSVCLLYFIPGSLSRNLTVLFSVLVGICLVLWLLAGVGYDVIDEYLLIQDVAFIIELILMAPRGLIDGLIETLRRTNLGGVFTAGKLSAYNRLNDLQVDEMEDS
jgi:hypothetical protein